MKNSILFLPLSCLFFFSACKDHPQKTKAIQSDPAIESRLQSLLEQKEYFKLRDEFENYGDQLAPEKKIYFLAFIKNVFNQTIESSRLTDTLLTKYSPAIVDSIKISLLELQRDNYLKSFRYADATKIDLEIVNQLKTGDSAKLAKAKNSLIIDEALVNTAPQKASIEQDDTIQWKNNELGLMVVPVKHQNAFFDFVFDTRAGTSTITQSFAKKLGLKMLDVSYDEYSGITGIKFRSGLGIADSLYLGKVLLQQVVFQVVPDKILYFDHFNFYIDGIIGLPVIRVLPEVHIYQDGLFTLKAHPAKGFLNNLALDGSTTVVSFKTNEDTLCFHFDLGANNTELYHNYFERYKPEILRTAKLKTVQLGGAGGMVNREVYVLPAIDLYIGDKKVRLDSIDVLTQPIYPGQRFYGNVGQDLVKKFKELILNFDSMYVDFR